MLQLFLQGSKWKRILKDQPEQITTRFSVGYTSIYREEANPRIPVCTRRYRWYIHGVLYTPAEKKEREVKVKTGLDILATERKYGTDPLYLSQKRSLLAVESSRLRRKVYKRVSGESPIASKCWVELRS